VALRAPQVMGSWRRGGMESWNAAGMRASNLCRPSRQLEDREATDAPQIAARPDVAPGIEAPSQLEPMTCEAPASQNL
jgi:hypothetical protein